MLNRRLKSPVKRGIMYNSAVNTRPQRFECLLTERGKSFFPVLITPMPGDNPSLNAGDIAVQPVSRQCGTPVMPVLLDRHTHEPLPHFNVAIAAGPGAKRRLNQIREMQNQHEANPHKESL
ncbi:hypothetical protein ACL2XP_14735 [Sodalis sp. RH21]|uniref:hypothetical protein n=1 Tax=unclassified Sodalis (in: enterobacteria) TaxID=2636512 RepID=UPI0039B60EE6